MGDERADPEAPDSDLSLALMSIETGAEKLGVRGLLLRDLVRVIQARKPRIDVDTTTPAWPARGREEAIQVEEDGLGVTVRVEGMCHHARRCLRQLEQGFNLGCIRSLEVEAAINSLERAQYAVVHRDLGPGRVCIFQLRPVLSPRPSNLMDAPLLEPREPPAQG